MNEKAQHGIDLFTMNAPDEPHSDGWQFPHTIRIERGDVNSRIPQLIRDWPPFREAGDLNVRLLIPQPNRQLTNDSRRTADLQVGYEQKNSSNWSIHRSGF